MMIGNSFSTSGDFRIQKTFQFFPIQSALCPFFAMLDEICSHFIGIGVGVWGPFMKWAAGVGKYEWVEKPVWASKLIAGKSVKREKQSCSQTRSFWGRRFGFGLWDNFRAPHRRDGNVEIVIISSSCRSCLSSAILQQCVHKFIKEKLSWNVKYGTVFPSSSRGLNRDDRTTTELNLPFTALMKNYRFRGKKHNL